MAKRVAIFSNCVVRDALEFSKTHIVKYISQSAIGSAFATKPFKAANDKLIAETIEHKFLRRCVRQDLSKQAKRVLLDNDYEAIIIDYIDERYKRAVLGDERATLSNSLKNTGIKTNPKIHFCACGGSAFIMVVPGLERADCNC